MLVLNLNDKNPAAPIKSRNHTGLIKSREKLIKYDKKIAATDPTGSIGDGVTGVGVGVGNLEWSEEEIGENLSI